ncbi:ABC transporter permease [Kitasatospora sp. HPMI-4]|uniref:ABC transporter permease n=1 Tax=Kitasatospora sp. HPMI-4 TaxID=3448443 RepID=UPI003F1D2AF2
MNKLRVFFIDSWLAYRGGFRILTPAMFVPTVILQPIAELLFFLQLGHYAGARDPSFYVVGNALYSCAIGGMFSMSVAVAMERRNNTLVMVLAAPVNRLLLFAGRMVPAFCVGLCTGLVTLGTGWLATDFRLTPTQLAGLLGALMLSTGSACAFGLLVGTVGLRARDINFLAGLVLTTCLLLSGANVPVSDFPAPIRLLADLMPMTLSIEGARRNLDGRPGALALLGAQALLIIGYVLVAAVVLRVIERSARSAATLETS